MSPAVTTAYFAAGGVATALGTVAFLYVRLVDEDNAAFHTVITAVAAVAAVAYTSMALGVGIVTVGSQTIFVGRYVQWLLGTPLIVLYLGMLAGAGRNRLVALMVVDVLSMGAALGAAVTTGTARWGVFAVGTALYAVLLYGLVSTLGDAAQGRSAPVVTLFEKLRNLTVVTWSFYPVVWLVGPLGLGVVDPFAEVLLITYLDVVAKVGFGFIAVNSRIAMAKMPRLDSLRAWRETLA